MKKIFTILAVSALAITAQAQTTFNYVMSAQGFTNAQVITSGDILAGKLTYEALKNASSNSPSYFNTGTNLRLYSETTSGNGNSYSVKAVGGVKINSVRIKTDNFQDYAPMSAIITVDGVTVPTVKDPADAAVYVINAATPASDITIKNGQTGTSAQIRIQEIAVTYTDGLSVVDFSKASSILVKNTVVGESIAFAKNADIQIINTAGQIVKTAKVTEGSTLNVSSLAKGVYIVTGTVNGEKVSQKVIKN